MKTALFAWELGGGLGHLMQMQPLARHLARCGHRVVVALRRLAGADAFFAGTGAAYFQAPYQADVDSKLKPFPRTATFSQVLCNAGWNEDDRLFPLAVAWRNLFQVTRPDLVVFDHSPTALLASRGLPLRRVVIGSGFCCPPDVCPWPVFHPDFKSVADPARILAGERRVLDRVNRLLRAWRLPPLERMAQIYSEVDETFLLTFPELDHYPGRSRARYVGPLTSTRGGETSPWPLAEGKRVFAYLKPFAGLAPLLARLNELRTPTIAYVDGIDAALKHARGSATLRIEDRPLDLSRVARECDLAILNAGHGTTAELLLAGKPILQIPLVLEQRLNAAAVTALGAGEEAPAAEERFETARLKLDQLLQEPRYSQAARRFADLHASFDADATRDEICRRIEALVAGARPQLASRRTTPFADARHVSNNPPHARITDQSVVARDIEQTGSVRASWPNDVR